MVKGWLEFQGSKFCCWNKSTFIQKWLTLQVISIWHKIVCKIKNLVEIFFSMDSMLCSIRGTNVSHYLVQFLWNSESDSSESLGGDKMREGKNERIGAFFTCTKHLPSLAMTDRNISSAFSFLVYSCCVLEDVNQNAQYGKLFSFIFF